MRIVLMLALLGACMDGEETPDATLEAPSSLDVPVGERCDVRKGLVCGAGVLGACIDSVCMQQCSPVLYPRCADGLTERHVPLDASTMVCVCD